MTLFRASLAASTALLISCTVNKYYVTPPAPAVHEPSRPIQSAPAEPPPPDGAIPPAGAVPMPTPEPEAAAPSELERRFAVAKAFLSANHDTYSLDGTSIGRVGRPGEQAPILEAPGGGFLLVVNRKIRELVTHPVVVRLDAAGNVAWTIELPRPTRFNTFEVNGGVLAPDHTLVVEVTPFTGLGTKPHAALISKITLTGTLVWSMQLAAGPGVDGPYPQNMTIDDAGLIHLFGHATYQREGARAPGTGDWVRTWRGTVSPAGRALSSTIGGLFHEDLSDTYRPPYRPADPFWYPLARS